MEAWGPAVAWVMLEESVGGPVSSCLTRGGPLYLIDLPMSSEELAVLHTVTLPHDLLNLDIGLEVGQICIGQDDDGAYWGVQVAWVRFTETETVYRFSVGQPIPPEAVEILRPLRLSAPYTRGEVSLLLRARIKQRLSSVRS